MATFYCNFLPHNPMIKTSIVTIPNFSGQFMLYFMPSATIYIHTEQTDKILVCQNRYMFYGIIIGIIINISWLLIGQKVYQHYLRKNAVLS